MELMGIIQGEMTRQWLMDEPRSYHTKGRVKADSTKCSLGWWNKPICRLEELSKEKDYFRGAGSCTKCFRRQ